jgi:hypothetical protein
MFDRAARKPVRGDYDRTWLSDDYFDLIVWHAPDDTIHGLQLCYGKPAWERALTWRSGRGFSHMRVDDGESNAWGNQTPFCCQTALFQQRLLSQSSRRRGAELRPHIRDLVLEKIAEYVRTRNV